MANIKDSEALMVPEPSALARNAVEAITNDELVVQYAALATEIGFAPEDLVLYQLRTLIRDTGLRIYDLEEVEDFMNSKFGGVTCTRDYAGYAGNYKWKYTFEHKWGWHPLRVSDTQVSQQRVGGLLKYQFGSARLRDKTSTSTTRVVQLSPYNRLVPFPVLKTVSAISKAFPSVSFIVADWVDYETTTIVPIPRAQDPFLAVLGPGIPVMVIERWDEPGFNSLT